MSRFAHHMPFGTELDANGTRFRLWAPDAQNVELVIGEGKKAVPMRATDEGWRETHVGDTPPGTFYQFRIDGGLCVPDPASRFQPKDVHGPSEVIDPSSYLWKTPDWAGRPWQDAVFYELHPGTFSRQGTYAGAADKLDYLADLGVTAVELMPVSDFPGHHNWGYDGVAPYAPDSAYGRPEDLKAFIDAAHGRNLMVFLDVVYNHFGPEGNYLHVYAERFFDRERQTPWGAAISFDRPDSRTVRDYFIHNALYWLEEYRFDGLRLDAVHAIDDRSEPDILEELAETVHDRFGRNRHVHLVLENDSNQARYLERQESGLPRHYTAQWNDDIHHVFHSLLTGETRGYYADYAEDTPGRLARCLTTGFAYQGEASAFRGGETRGEPSGHLPTDAFVNFLQNHDQVGNRAFGDRLAALTSPEALQAATAILLLAPFPPLLFMGQEWGAAQPFLFFCDLGDELKDAVREGRRKEFSGFPEFRNEEARKRIPDPTAGLTFTSCILDWPGPGDRKAEEWLSLHRTLLDIRSRELTPRLSGTQAGQLTWRDGGAMAIAWRLGDGSLLTLIANLSDRSADGVPASTGRPLFTTGGFNPEDADRTIPPWSVGVFLEDAMGE